METELKLCPHCSVREMLRDLDWLCMFAEFHGPLDDDERATIRHVRDTLFRLMALGEACAEDVTGMSDDPPVSWDQAFGAITAALEAGKKAIKELNSAKLIRSDEPERANSWAGHTNARRWLTGWPEDTWTGGREQWLT